MIIVSDIWLACDIVLPCIFGCAQLTVQISENGAQTVDKIFFFLNMAAISQQMQCRTK